MYATERQDRIIEELQADGRVSVTTLSRSFDVTSETIRRDLDALEALGALRRVHGGAVRWSAAAESVLAERQSANRPAKHAIARAAIAMLSAVGPAAIALDAGTTTGMLAELLATWKPVTAQHPPRDIVLDVITHAVPIVTTLQENPHLAVHAIGGLVRPTTSAAVGEPAVQGFLRLRPDIAFLGANGMSAGFGLSTPDEREAGVKAAMVRSARRAIVLVDSSKHDVESLIRFAALDALDTVITDRPPGPQLASALREADVDVVLA